MSESFIRRAKNAARILIGGNASTSQSRREIRSISAQEIEEAKAFFPRDKFFIFGHARSGTTMLTRLIRLHPEVHCDYQRHFFTRPPLLQSLVSEADIASWLARPSNRWNRGEDLSPVILRAAADFVLERDARRTGARIVGDKSPNNLMNGEAVNLMHQVYPDARLIYILRDGRDAALSHRFQSFIDFPQHLSEDDLRIREAFARNPDPFLNGERSIFTPKSIRQAARTWVQNVEETHRQGKALYADRYLSLRYEDLLADPDTEMMKLWAFLGADTRINGLNERIQDELSHNPDAEWQREKAKDIAEPLQKGKKGSWQDMFTENDRQVFQQIAGELLDAWNYPERLD